MSNYLMKHFQKIMKDTRLNFKKILYNFMHILAFMAVLNGMLLYFFHLMLSSVLLFLHLLIYPQGQQLTQIAFFLILKEQNNKHNNKLRIHWKNLIKTPGQDLYLLWDWVWTVYLSTGQNVQISALDISNNFFIDIVDFYLNKNDK